MTKLIHYTHYTRQIMTNQNLALIVEDECSLQIIYSRSVAIQGYETLIAGDGRVALDLLQTYTPSLIFLDMLLPLVSGVEVLQYIAHEARFNKTHVVIMSSNSEFRNQQYMFHSCEFYLKPLLPSNIQTITTRLNKPHAS
jgi:DNA-binding response OmpR family regulator